MKTKKKLQVRWLNLLLVVLLAAPFSGCATYTPCALRMDQPGPQAKECVNGDLAMFVEEFASTEKSKRAFDAAMNEKGILPILLKVENRGEVDFRIRRKDITVGSGIPLKPLNPEEAAKRIKRNAVGQAIGLSLIVPIITIPVVVAGTISQTNKVNKQISEDFSAKTYPDGILKAGNEQWGFVFFEMDKERPNLDGLQLTLKAENLASGEWVEIATPLPPAAFKVRKSPPHQERPGKS